MAAGSAAAAARGDRNPASNAGRRRWAPRGGEEDADEDPAVLVLSYFSRPPFLSFGRLRVGASRTRLLAVDNPNEDDAEVVIDRFPAAARGFSIEPRRFFVESGQRIFVSVTWTPLEEGKIRELVSFVVNDVIKHQAVLLGAAEQPPKKRKSLWDTLKKKNSSVTSAVKVKKSTSEIKNVNKTFQVSHEVDRLRSPLQSCENQNTVQKSTSQVNDPPAGSENQLPPSPIASVPEEHGSTVHTPLALRRSTAFGDIAASGNKELLPETDICIINKCVTEHSQLQPESASSSAGLAQLPISNDGAVLNFTLSPVSTPEHSASAPALSTRRILSPDAFVNDNYQVDIDVIEQPYPILSPDQFVKDSLSDKPSKTPKPDAALRSSTTQTYVVKRFLPSKWKKDGGVETETHVHIEHNLNEVSELHKVKSQALDCDKPKEDHCSFPSAAVLQTDNPSQREQTKKRPILSATVIKSKRGAAEETRTETRQPKSKKCLNKAISGCANVVPGHREAETSKHLPVTASFSSENKCHNDKVNSSPTRSTSSCRKRKSETYVGNRVTAPVQVEEVERKRALTSSTDNQTRTTRGPSAFKPTSGERVGQRKKAGSSLQKASKATKRISKPVPGLAQSHLTFVKPLKTVIPRHPMPFAAKNMFYDERWKEKQQRGFTWWLNFVLTPDDFNVKTNTSQVNAAALILGEENHHKRSLPKAPTKDEASLKAYTARRKLNRLRREACRLFTSESMVKAIQKLEVEIETRRLLVRRDRHLWKDIGERQKVLNWLLSYNPLWLRIGLETVYGELIALESNSDVMGLAIFILNRLLWNPDIATEYRHPVVPHLYREGHEEALSKFTLKKLLLLVCFLDCAKQSRMIDHDPCLFCKDAEFKASKDLLLAFSRDFLSGEGDLSRHLGFLGLPVSHVQTPLDEFDFAVTNLAVDLQCGIRLVRTVELLTKNWSLSKQLRVPAISRLQKMHNVEIVLNVLKERGVHLKDETGTSIDSRDIVDRHRERTLALLWKIVFAFQVDVFLNVEHLKEEIEFLKNTYKTKALLGARKTSSNYFQVQEDGSNISSQTYSENVKLLMAWVNAVCRFYNIKVENFTVCFSDGRVLCHLIHHYHPCYMPLEAVCQRTTQTVECSRTVTVGLNSSSSSESDTSLNVVEETFDQTVTPSVLYKELLDNEKQNFQLINAAVSDLGGIPAMIHHADMSNTIPDEKVVITYLSFLCSRLLDLRQETRAARLIQAAWRKYRLKRELKLSQERDRAARIIQKSAMNFLARRRILRKKKAAIFIQKHWRGYLARMTLFNLKKAKLEEARNKSATVIQAYWRRYFARRRYLQLRHCVIFVQARIRMVKSVAAYKQIVWATVTIQRHLRATKLAKTDRQRYQILKSSALTIQSAFRRWRKYKIQQKIKAAFVIQSYFRKWQSSKLAKRRRAALVIQSWYRMHRDLKQYLHVKQNVIKIQAWYRCQLARRVYQEHRAKIVTIQQYYRAYKLGKGERQCYLQKRAAVIVLQAAFRGMKARELYRQAKAACVIQSLWRMKQEKQRFLQLKKSVTTLQSHVRKYQQVKRYKEIKNAASVIQTRYRAHMAAKKAAAAFQRVRLAAIVLQSAYRGMQARRQACILRSVIKIQSGFRAYVVRKRFKNLRDATVKIQALAKMRQVRKRYCALREAVLYVQRRYRSRRHALQFKEDYRKLKRGCIRIQALVRGYLVRKQIQRWREAAILLQACYRMKRDRQRYLSIYSAATVIQQRYRACKKTRCHRQEFLQVRKAAVCLQAAYRGYKTRKKLKLECRAAIKIQTAFRTHAARVKHKAMVQASIVIQRWYRNCKGGKRQRLNFLMTRAAVLSLQAAFRGWRVRKQIQRQHVAATKIQSTFRKFMAMKKFRLVKHAVLTIQRHYRATVLGQRQQQEYVQLRNAAVRLQALWRGRAVRKTIQKKHHLATIIQSYYRRHINQLKYKKLRQATLVIQKYYRAYCMKKTQRLIYLKTKAAALVLQSAYRGMTVRRQLNKLNRAATTIQAAFKSYLVKKEYGRLRSAAIAIQRRYRAVTHAKCQRQRYLSLKRATVQVQAIYRGVRVRRQVQCMHQAAVCIQATFKMYCIRIKYRSMRMAAIRIQRQYRAFCLGQVQRKKYLELKKSVIILQAACRGMKVRQDLKTMHQSAAIIQSYYRMHKQQRNFRKLLLATRQIQQWFRACKERDAQVHKYMVMKNAVLHIQAVFRGRKTRRLLRTMNESAVIIQRRFRTFLERKRFLSIKSAAVVIQRKYRATKIANIQRQKYLSLLNAAVIIQSAYRGFMVRKKILQMHQAATVIQAMLRMHKIYTSYRTLRLASVIIQQRYRAYREGKREREKYLKLYNSVLVLQAAYRGMKMRCFLKRQREAALTIQRNYRMYRQYCHYRRVQWAAQLIQRRYRAHRLRKIAVEHYTSLKKAATCIQRAFRDMRVRKQQQEMHRAATVVQKNFKAFRERQRYLSLKAATLVFQRRYRALALARQHALEYHSLRRAVIHIQAVYRGVRVRRSLKHMHSAARTIQAAYRMLRDRKAYQNMRTVAMLIQNYYRSYLKGKNQRKKYLTLKNSVLVIQAAYRGMRARQELKLLHVSAVVIQSSYRMYVQRRCYKQLCWAATVTQQRFRAKMAREAAMRNYAETRKAVICLQAAFRGRKARQLYKANAAARRIQSFLRMCVERRRFLAQKSAAVTIQSLFRCRRARTRYALLRSSAVAVQRWYRWCLRARAQRAQYLAQRQAIVVIQSAFRAMKARKTARQLQAARKIQSFLQMALQRRRYIQLRAAAVTLQSYYLMHKCKSQYMSYKRAAVVLQRHYRSHLIVKQQRMAYLQTRRNVVLVQATVRGYIERKRFLKMKESTIKIQASFRGFIQRQKYLLCKFSAVLIQQHYRAHRMRNIDQHRFHQMKKAAITIQAAYRGYKARQWVSKMRAARVIQAWFRGHKARKEYVSVLRATLVIQSHFRAKQLRTRFLKMKSCALTIQRVWRATRAARRLRQQFLATRSAAVKIQLAYRQYRARRLLREYLFQKHQAARLIQNTYRGFKARRKFVQQKAAAVIIQKHLRAWQEGRLQFMKYNKTRRAVIKLQAFIRGYLVRKKISEQKQKKRLLYFAAAAYHHISAIKIQRAYRIHLTLKLAQTQISSVLTIQSWFRAKLQRRRFLRDYRRVVGLQRALRGWLKRRNEAATVIQRNARAFLARRRRRRLAAGIIKFQALWRGYYWRKMTDTAKTRALRRSLEKANEKSREENKLGNRTAIAIDHLLKYKHLSYILAALKHLEVATRLSPLCCENMAQSRAIFSVFLLIRSCNRSVPCMDVIRYSVQVLLNVSKYERTTRAVYEAENSIDTLLDLLQMYRGKAGDKVSEKGGSIFTKTCCLLAILSKDSKRALEIRGMPRTVSCIQSLYKLTARKHRMDAERTLVKQKTNTALGGSSSVPVTPLRIKTVSRIKPDWVLRKDNMQEVVDPLQAILMVMDTLVVVCSRKLFAEDIPCDLPQIENGNLAQYYYSFKSYYFPMHKGKKLSYSCMVGYTTESGTQDGRITCTAKGWSPVPRCYRRCTKPLLENGSFYSTEMDFKIHEKLQYKCNPGYHTPSGATEDTVQCQPQGWSFQPSCTKKLGITCSTLSEVAHGGFYPVKKTYEEGDVVHFFCDKHYSVTGFDLIQCYNFGWYPDPPVCEGTFLE
ncbi:abnormal spindle-like microcephaly-associated protein isoform X6 [Anomalospiza imberbis]|uniref:abnormal spindle-like microcephaly-associated protein isoform X6 n=1 Tax=Anomalospiza imberbis TaxID=187417 RepID=UPI00358E569E